MRSNEPGEGSKLSTLIHMNKIIKTDKNGIAPVMIGFYGIVFLIGVFGWVFFLGNFLFAMGFTAASFVLVKWAKKKWVPGVMAMLVVMATLVLAYTWFSGDFHI